MHQGQGLIDAPGTLTGSLKGGPGINSPTGSRIRPAGFHIYRHVRATGIPAHSVVYLGDWYALFDRHPDDSPALPKLIDPGPC